MDESAFRTAVEVLTVCWSRFAQNEAPPSEHSSFILSIAEKLSAGELKASESDPKKSAPNRVVTIFDRISRGQEKVAVPSYLPLQPLSSAENSIFPSDRMAAKDDTAAVQQLKAKINAAFQDPEQDFATYLEQVLSALRQNAWCLPAPGYSQPCDVSFYDHVRISAAIAVCLAELSEEKLQEIDAALKSSSGGRERSTNQQNEALSTPVGILIGGDVSGIQSFIYTINGDKAAKALRGRSFYLQVLTEVLVRAVLKELDLPYSSVIYAGGGNFYLLAPLSAEEKLDQIREKIGRKMLAYHGTSLYLSIASAVVPVSGFQKGAITKHWNEMHKNLAVRKQQRYSEFGQDMISLIFEPESHGGNQEAVCSVCGEEKPDTKVSGDGDERICESCSSFHDLLGGNLPNTAYIRFSYGGEPESKSGTILDTLVSFGAGLELFDSRGNSLGAVGSKIKDPKRAILWEIDDPDLNWKKPKSELPTACYRHYAAARVPQMTFDEMQSRIENGTKRLGVLRMDVDSLGEVFQSGFGVGVSSFATLTRISALSFQLSLFFEGYLKRLCEKWTQVYTVYTGGDDVFLVGPWQDILALAEEIRDQFKAFTHGNPSFHISGGMSFIHGKYPIVQAAEDAKEAEDLAKNIDPEKNAFAFLGEAFKWDQFTELRKKKERLVGLGAALPSSLLQLLQQLDAQQVEAQQRTGAKKQFGRWMWMGEYQLYRMEEQYKHQPDVKNELEKIRTELKKSYYMDLHQWAKAARWAQLATRKE